MKSPAFSFYVRDWLCSKTVNRLHAEALPKPYQTSTNPLPTAYQPDSSTTNLRSRGLNAYLFLLCCAWLEDPPATLPDNDQELAAMARVTTEEWEAIKSILMPAFKKDTSSGRLFSERQMEEFLKQKHRSRVSTNNVRNRYQTSTNCSPTLEDANANANAIPSEQSCVDSVMTAGIPEHFSRYVYQDWSSRGGKDASGTTVNFLHYVIKRWNREKLDWHKGNHKGNRKAKDLEGEIAP